MRKQFLPGAVIVIFFLLILSSCEWRIVRGNGTITTNTRKEGNFKSVSAAGSFDVYFSQDSENEIKIEADENLMKYIITEVENGTLKIKTRNGINLRPTQDIKVYITSQQYEDITLAGSGNMQAQTKLSSTNRIKFSIAGSGDINVPDIDAPKVEVHIAGSGKVGCAGTTKDSEIHVAGSGDVDLKGLKAENAEIHIAGSGNVWVYASMKLEVHVAGGGDIHYYGNPTDIQSKMAGSGNLIKEQ
jgi:hypothetical protein